MVRFEDTDPRPYWGDDMAGRPLQGDVSPGFARQREERQRAADEASRPDRLEELGRGLAALVSPHKPPPPEGYAEAVAEANRRAHEREPLDGRTPDFVFALRRAYVAGFIDHWLASR